MRATREVERAEPEREAADRQDEQQQNVRGHGRIISLR